VVKNHKLPRIRASQYIEQQTLEIGWLRFTTVVSTTASIKSKDFLKTGTTIETHPHLQNTRISFFQSEKKIYSFICHSFHFYFAIVRLPLAFSYSKVL
jgi:hypothetical protein